MEQTTRAVAWSEYEIPVARGADQGCRASRPQDPVAPLRPQNHGPVKIDYIFTTRGDVFHTELAEGLGAELDEEGQIKVDQCMRTNGAESFMQRAA